MKILFWAPYINRGGGLKLIRSLLHGFANTPGLSAVRVVLPSEPEPSSWLPDSTCGKIELWPIQNPAAYNRSVGRIAGIPFTSRLHREWLRRTHQPVHASEYLQARFDAAAQGCDIAYCPWPHDHHGYGLLPKSKIPWVVTVQDFLALDFPWDATVTLREYVNLRDVVERANHLVFSSQASLDAHRRHFPQCGTPTSIIHHAIQPDSSVPLAATRSPAERYFLAATSIVPHKNIDLLLLAWSRWNRAKEFPLIVFGALTDAIHPLRLSELTPETWARQVMLQALISRLGNLFPDRVKTLGYVNDTRAADILVGATALIMPSMGEGGGSYPVEEALNSGVPVLCSDIPAMREHLSHRSAPITWFDPYSVDSLLRALDNFLDNESAYRAGTVDAASDTRPTWLDIGSAYASVLQCTLDVCSSPVP